MSTYTLTMQPMHFMRLLSVEPYATEGGRDLEAVEQQVRELQRSYEVSTAITDRQALLEQTFLNLANRWREATRFESSLARMTAHPAYRAIVQLGETVVPLLLCELKRHPEPWFAALREITHADPVTPEQRGNWQAMTDAWLRWGREHGLA